MGTGGRQERAQEETVAGRERWALSRGEELARGLGAKTGTREEEERGVHSPALLFCMPSFARLSSSSAHRPSTGLSTSSSSSVSPCERE